MKIEIISVTKGEFEEVNILHIYPHSQQMHRYRRYVTPITGEIVWEHYLGNLHGWHRYTVTEFLEDAYQIWLRNEKSTATNL